jgi:putative transposase
MVRDCCPLYVAMSRARKERTSVFASGLRIECAISSPRASQSGRSSTNAIERLHEEFKRRIKTLTVLPSADTAAMLFWALLASGQINMRKVDGWQTLATTTIDQPIDLAA